jgi:2-C-methyl-D-erythritol 4-phosphate cytidylyltransferase
VLVVPPSTSTTASAATKTVAGGDRRSDSVRAGLATIPETAEIVVVHDAARPFAQRSLFDAVIDAVVAGADAAVPGVSVTDTVKRIDTGEVVETLDRDTLVAVQTPQAFAAAALRKAHAGAPDASDDAALVEAQGGRVVVVPGDPGNYKITTPRDMSHAQWFVDHGGLIG